MSTAAAATMTPKRWCERVLARLPEQAGIVWDGDAVATMLSDLAAGDPAPEAFPVLLATLERDPRPEVATVAGRIRHAWERDVAKLTGTQTEPKPRALIVDDEPDVAEMVATVLEPRFAVSTATNGQQAVALARAERPALVVLDVMMPEMNGYEVARVLRDDPTTAAARILFCTARSGIDARLQGREAGGDGYVVKPFELYRLAAQASSIVGLDPLGA
ncbi:MAG TPA: response regulator [Chloroflexota bacterium]|nr:response regulator [Chloroflexota bacterium]